MVHRNLQIEFSTVYGICLKICISLLLFQQKMFKICIDSFPAVTGDKKREKGDEIYDTA